MSRKPHLRVRKESIVKGPLLIVMVFSTLVLGDSKLEKRVKLLEETVEKLEVQVGVLNERSNLIAGRTQISFLDAWYLRTGLLLLFPKSSTFSLRTDTGLGIFMGAGRYLGRNHVVDGGLDWDLYPSATLRYRYEWRNKNQTVNLAPILGIKTRIARQNPLDNFYDPAENLKGVYGIVGIGAGFPVGLTIVQAEVLTYLNRQFFVVASLGIHFFV